MAVRTHTHTHSVNAAGGTTTQSVSITGDGEDPRELIFASTATDQQVDLAVVVARMKSFFLVPSAAVTIKVGSSGSPTATITLAFGAMLPWYTGCGYTNPFGSTDFTKLYVSCAAGTTLHIDMLQDSTP